jgi:hypothetical protein
MAEGHLIRLSPTSTATLFRNARADSDTLVVSHYLKPPGVSGDSIF